MRISRLILFLFLLGSCWPSFGQETMRTDTISVKIYFRQGYSTFEPSFRDNAARLDAFVARLHDAAFDTLRQVRSIRIVGGASPELVS